MKAREVLGLFFGWKTLIRLLVVGSLFYLLDIGVRFFGPVGGDIHVGCPIPYKRISIAPPPFRSSSSFDATKLSADVGIYWAIAVLWSLRARGRAARPRRPPMRAPVDRT